MKRHIILLALLCVGCQKTGENNVYYLDVVCQIYTDVHASETGQSEKEGSIYEQILAKLPEFKDNYQYISVMDPDQRYPTYKKLAELDGNPDWECPVIEEYIDALINSVE